ncbi:DNase1 protein [Zalerion maritima]|uniref:DNase1 protein n=1 Tax=Zalerion maritima TaxID=339359 RepID=A0AAD5RS76_9PEZI|nr:DNase1 protein [Zalerion maritima]
MKAFATIVTLLASVVAVAANTVSFIGEDSTTRTVYFTPNEGGSEIDAVTVEGGASVSVDFPDSWVGNWYAIKEGDENIPGMLGEVAFNAWGDITFFDVSAIVNADDKDNVKLIYPASGMIPTSGCESFPCDNAYYLPDDVQTKATSESELICTLGSSSSDKKRDLEAESPLPNFKRDFVLGKYA